MEQPHSEDQTRKNTFKVPKNKIASIDSNIITELNSEKPHLKVLQSEDYSKVDLTQSVPIMNSKPNSNNSENQ